MEFHELFNKYNEDGLIKLIKKNKYKGSLEELFLYSINTKKNKLVEYLINEENVDLNYKTKYGWDSLVTAIINGNLFVIELLKQKGVDIKRNFLEYDREVCSLKYIRDLDTLKYFESNVDKKHIKKVKNDIVCNTLVSHDVELLDYVVKQYSVKLSNVKYDKDNFLLDVEHFMGIMKNLEKERAKQVSFVSLLLKGEKKYSKILMKAEKVLESIINENREIEKYYNYVKEKYKGEL